MSSTVEINHSNIIGAMKMYDLTPRLNKTLRVGQHLCNVFGVTDNEIYYETDNRKALQEFKAKYQVK